MSKKLVSQANLLVFGVLVAFLVVIGFTTWDRMTAARLAREWTEHTYGVLGCDPRVSDCRAGRGVR